MFLRNIANLPIKNMTKTLIGLEGAAEITEPIGNFVNIYSDHFFIP